MLLDDYLDEARKTAIYPRDRALEYLALGLCSEAGEVAGKIKKEIRDGSRNSLMAELGDVLWYFVMLADELDLPIESIALANILKLRDRQERGVINGSGDER